MSILIPYELYLVRKTLFVGLMPLHGEQAFMKYVPFVSVLTLFILFI